MEKFNKEKQYPWGMYHVPRDSLGYDRNRTWEKFINDGIGIDYKSDRSWEEYFELKKTEASTIDLR